MFSEIYAEEKNHICLTGPPTHRSKHCHCVTSVKVLIVLYMSALNLYNNIRSEVGFFTI